MHLHTLYGFLGQNNPPIFNLINASIYPSLQERAMRELSPIGSSLTQHLHQLLRTATRKFNTWQERRIRHHR